MPDRAAELPTWALRQADAALRCGQTSAQIETVLVAKGLEPNQAADVVTCCLELRISRQNASDNRRDRFRLWNRIASIVAASILVVIVAVRVPDDRRVEALVRTIGFLVFPMACIWLPDALGRYANPGRNLRSTPALFVAVAGWIVILAVLGMAIAGIGVSQNQGFSAGR